MIDGIVTGRATNSNQHLSAGETFGPGASKWRGRRERLLPAVTAYNDPQRRLKRSIDVQLTEGIHRHCSCKGPPSAALNVSSKKASIVAIVNSQRVSVANVDRTPKLNRGEPVLMIPLSSC
jgi:hypothetical protein